MKPTRTPALQGGEHVRGRLLLAGLTLCGFALWDAAWAAPPAVGSDDWNIMAPFKEWVTGQHDTFGRWCCDLSDGRPVEAEIRGDHWEVHVTPQHFPDEPDRWLAVPDAKITRNGNPTGTPILWMYQGRVQCFSPPNEG